MTHTMFQFFPLPCMPYIIMNNTLLRTMDEKKIISFFSVGKVVLFYTYFNAFSLSNEKALMEI